MLTHGLPAATKTRRGAPAARSAGSSAIMDAVVTTTPRTCMQTLTPLPSVSTPVGGAWTGPSVPGAPQGPVP